MKTYKANFQVQQPTGVGDVVNVNKEATVKADTFAEARRTVKVKYKGINIKLVEVK